MIVYVPLDLSIPEQKSIFDSLTKKVPPCDEETHKPEPEQQDPIAVTPSIESVLELAAEVVTTRPESKQAIRNFLATVEVSSIREIPGDRLVDFVDVLEEFSSIPF